MLQRLRHIIIASMLAVILVPMMAPASLLVQKWWVKWEMKEKLEKDDLQWVTVASNEVKWYITGKECIIAGKMFDVKQVREQEGKLLLLGIFDEKETEIEKKLSSTELPNDHERSMLIFHMVHLALENTDSKNRLQQPDIAKAPMLSIYKAYSGQSHRHITTPPPEA